MSTLTRAGAVACAAWVIGCADRAGDGTNGAAEAPQARGAAVDAAAPATPAAATSAPPTVDVCGLFSAADAKAVTGREMKEHSRTAMQLIPHGYCSYVSVTRIDSLGPGEDATLLEVRVYDDRGVASTGEHRSAAGFHHALKQALVARGGDRLTPVAGLGEDAYDLNGTLKVLQGEHIVEVAVHGMVLGAEGPARRREAAIQAVRIILGRL